MRRLAYRLIAATAAAAALGLGLTVSSTAWAQGSYPSKAIHFYTGFAVGGGTDILARALAAKLGPAMNNVPVVVESYPGANGNIAAEMVSRAPGDGYTLMMTTAPHAVNASIFRKLRYDPVKDFTPVISIASVPMLLVVSASSPVRSVADLIALAKSKPGQVTFSSGGEGSIEHLSGLQLEQATGTKLLHVPYKGSGSSLTDLIAGRIDMAFNTAPSVMPLIKSGTLRAIAISDRERAAILPDVPTMSEAGVPGFVSTTWYGVLAPAGVPKEALARLNAELGKILLQQDMKDLFGRLGAKSTGGTPEQFGAFLASEINKYAKIVKDFDLYLN
jgi:tripartite-type tricarboxylate transporter receptor subunit TctC